MAVADHQRTPVPNSASARDVQPFSNTFGDEAGLLRLVFTLFLTFRLLTLVLLRPGGYFGDWTDLNYYREFAALSLNGYYPYVHYWMEYPPILPWLAVLLYQLTVGLPTFGQPGLWFQLAFGLVLALADLGNLWLVCRVGRHLGGNAWAIRCVVAYAGFFYPVNAMMAVFDGLAIFFLLIAVERCLARAPGAAGAAVAVGALTKVFPAFALPALLWSLPTWRERVRFGLAGTVVAAAVVGPLLALSPEMVFASLTGLIDRGSWESIWAILDGYYGSGLVASLSDRLFYPPSASWSHPQNVGPLWLPFGIGAGIVAVIAAWKLAQTAVGLVRAVAFVIAVFLLTSKGFSPQFTLWLLPFVALLAPSWRGAAWVAAFTINNVLVEGYLYFHLFPTHRWLLWATTAFRMVLLIVLIVELIAPTIKSIAGKWVAAKQYLAVPAAIALTILVAIAGIRLAPSYVEAAAQRTLGEGQRTALQTIVRETTDDAVIVFTRADLLELLTPYLAGRTARLVADPKLAERQGPFSARSLLTRLTEGHQEVALVSVMAAESEAHTDLIRTVLRTEWEPAGDWQTAGVRVERFVPRSAAAEQAPKGLRDVSFGDRLLLVSYDRLGTALPGEEIEVVVEWQAIARMDRDYTVFVHLLNEQEQVVAQDDAMPLRNLAPTSGWQVGERLRDVIPLRLPTDLPSGEYLIEIGVYYVPTLERLPILRNGTGDRLILERLRVPEESGGP